MPEVDGELGGLDVELKRSCGRETAMVNIRGFSAYRFRERPHQSTLRRLKCPTSDRGQAHA